METVVTYTFEKGDSVELTMVQPYGADGIFGVPIRFERMDPGRTYRGDRGLCSGYGRNCGAV